MKRAVRKLITGLAVAAMASACAYTPPEQAKEVSQPKTKPTKNLQERVILALRSLQIRRPTPRLYDAALKKARARIDKSKGD